MGPYINGPDAETFQIGLDNYFAQRYRDRKYPFKQRYFDNHGREGAANIVDMVPPNMPANLWNDYIQHYTFPSTKARSAVNKRNKQKQTFKGHGGRTSLAQCRHMFGDSKLQQPAGAIEGYRRLYSDASGNFVQSEPANFYAQMIEMQRVQASNPNPMSKRDIMKGVLGPRRGWVRGIGPLIGGSSSAQVIRNSRQAR